MQQAYPQNLILLGVEPLLAIGEETMYLRAEAQAKDGFLPCLRGFIEPIKPVGQAAGGSGGAQGGANGGHGVLLQRLAVGHDVRRGHGQPVVAVAVVLDPEAGLGMDPAQL